MNTNIKIYLQLFAIAMLSVVIALIAREGLAWTSPASIPPGGSGVLKASNGNVGIGVINPLLQLHVNTGNQLNGALLLERLSTKPAFSITPGNSQVMLSAGVYYKGNVWTHQSDDGNNQIFSMDPGAGVLWYASNNASGSWNVAPGEVLWNHAGDWKNLVRSTSTGDSYITGGNVGIGTETPNYKLDVSGIISGTAVLNPTYAP